MIKLRKAKLKWNISFQLIPCNEFTYSEGIDLYNDLLRKARKKKYSEIIKTPKGNISNKTITPAYGIWKTNSTTTLVILDSTGMYKILLRNVRKEQQDDVKPGYKCFMELKKVCKKHNVDIDSYKVNNGAEIKQEIEKYIIKLENPLNKDLIINNAFHVDFHSAFPSGLVETHPEFRPVMEELYKNRKINPVYKQILVASIGYMQSVPCCGAKYAVLSRDAINRNNKKVRELAARLDKAGFEVLAFNTDGIWAVDKRNKGRVYHGEGEGPNLTQWAVDHQNCKIRFKSGGSYEFIENGKYYPVVRGETVLDRIKPRNEWVWGDIYNRHCEAIKYCFDNNDYIIKLGVENYEK